MFKSIYPAKKKRKKKKGAIMHKFVAVLYNFLEMKWSQLETGKKFI